MKTTAFRFGVLLAAVVLLALWAAPGPAQGDSPAHAAAAGRSFRPLYVTTCDNPHVWVGPLPLSTSGSTVGTGDDYNLDAAGACAGGGPQYSGTGLGEDDVHVIATDVDCTIAVSMTPTDGADLALYVLSPNCGDVAGNCVYVDDGGGGGVQEDVEFPATAGQYYYIIIDGFNGASGAYSLNIATSGSCQLADLYTALGDRVWYDTDGDGIQDPGEPGVGGVQLQLRTGSCTGAVVDTATSDASGHYAFRGWAAGTYCVTLSSTPGPAGVWKLSPADQGGDDTVDSDFDPYQKETGPLTLSADNPDVDLGMSMAGTIGGSVWCDANGNRAYDAGEESGGATMTLYADSDCNRIKEGVLRSYDNRPDGIYAFHDLQVGAPGGAPVCYVVGVEPTSMGTCSDPLTAIEEAVALDTSTPVVVGVDFGFQVATVAAVGDRVWYDIDQDGLQDAGEPGLGNITIHLHNNATCQGSPFGTDMTDASGFYGFGGLAPGTYCLSFADGVPSGWGVSPANQGGDDTIDSDPNNSTWKVENINLQGDDPTVDAGMFVYGRVSGGVWCDQNGNGIHDAPAEDVGGVTVRLHADTDCNSQPDSLQSSQDTAADGTFGFYSLKTGPPGGPPVCYVTQVDVGDMGACNQALTPITYPAALQADNAIFHQAFFGFGQPGTGSFSLGDRVWFDTDKDGVQEAGEYGLQNIGVDLYANAGCQGSPAASTTTDGAGIYLFAGLSPGTYCLSLLDGIPAGWHISPSNNSSDDTIDSDLDPWTSFIEDITLSADDLTRDAGLFASGQIEGLVFCDRDGDRVFDVGEGVDGVTMTLFDDDDCDTVAGSPRGSYDTVVQGWYAFNPVMVGPPGGPPVCHVVRVDVGDLGACNVAVSPLEQPVALTANNPKALSTHFIFELPQDVTRIYLPVVLRHRSSP